MVWRGATGVGAIRSDSHHQCSNSSLEFLRDVLYLVTYLSGGETLLAKHFVHHYKLVVGVRSEP